MNEHSARRRFGQNFLADARAAARIAAFVSPAADEAVIEIGPGLGAITHLLAEATSRLAVVEIDRDLAARLRERFGARLLVVEGNVLDQDFSRIAVALGAPPDAPVAVAGNLPYNVSKPIAMKLVAERASISRAVLMFQREVAARLTARPGSKEYGPLTVLAGRAFRIEPLFDLGPGAFRPAPKVVSTVTAWSRRSREDLPAELEPRLRATLAAAFAQRRKTLLANVRAALGGDEARARAALLSASLDPALRAEAVSPEGFIRLAESWPVGGDASR